MAVIHVNIAILISSARKRPSNAQSVRSARNAPADNAELFSWINRLEIKKKKVAAQIA